MKVKARNSMVPVQVLIDLEATKAVPRITSPSDLRRFFNAIDLRENGREPNWDEHLTVIDKSRKTGRTPT